MADLSLLDRDEPDNTIDSVSSILAWMEGMTLNVRGAAHLPAQAWDGQAALLGLLRETLTEAGKDVTRLRRHADD